MIVTLLQETLRVRLEMPHNLWDFELAGHAVVCQRSADLLDELLESQD